MRIRISQENIDKGVRFQECACPFYLALKESGIKAVMVGHFYSSIEGEFRNTNVNHSKRLTRWIQRFDQGKAVKPAGFELAGVKKPS